MKVVVVTVVLSLILGSQCIQIHSEYINVINLRLRNQKVDVPEEFLNELKLEIENPGTSIQVLDDDDDHYEIFSPKSPLPEEVKGISVVVDEYADKILKNIRSLIIKHGLDPMELPNNTLKLLPTGSITLSSGWLQDTSSLSRNGDVIVSYSSTTKNITFTVPIKFEALMFTYQYLTKVLLLSVKGEILGKVENLKINVQLTFDFKTDQASLDSFNIANAGKLSLEFTGNGLVDWLINIMTSIVTTFLHPAIIQIMQYIVKGGLQAAVDTVNHYINNILHPGTSTVASNFI